MCRDGENTKYVSCIIRNLTPAKLLGEWNWYLPSWLEWILRVSAESKPREDIPLTPPVPVA
jgi:hypothetical protein